MAFNKGTPEERFWQKVDRSGDEYWNWLATITPRGYGYFYSVPGATHGAHRLSYELAFGSIPAGLMVCHHCDNRICVRPDHLFSGNRQGQRRRHDGEGSPAVHHAHQGWTTGGRGSPTRTSSLSAPSSRAAMARPQNSRAASALTAAQSRELPPERPGSTLLAEATS